MDDVDFDSSDIEMPQPVTNPFAHLGKASIVPMLENAFENRKESKIQSKTLQYSLGAPGTRANSFRWLNRFQSFSEDVLKLSPQQTPTGEHLERFLYTIVKYLSGRTSRIDPTETAPSYNMVEIGLNDLISVLTFRHATFQLSAHERMRISNVLEDLVQKELLTKDPKREAQWLGAVIAVRMSKALLINALDEGTLSWDIVLSKALSIIMTASTMGRSGDIARSRWYKGSECLLYKHIQLKLVEIDGLEKLCAKVTLHFEKGRKDTVLSSRAVRFNCLTEPGSGAACPITLLVVLALRTGAVESTTIEDLLHKARSRKDKTVLWKHGDRPVVAAIDIHTHQLVLDKPAGCHQINSSVQLAAELAGITDHVIAHDLRRGSAADTYNLKDVETTSVAFVATCLGHSMRAVNQGITQQYIGPTRKDLWKQRIDAGRMDSIGDQDPFGVTFSEQPFKRRRVESGSIDEYCIENNMDATDTRSRLKAGQLIREREKGNWAGSAHDQGEESRLESDSRQALTTLTQSDVNQQLRPRETVRTDTATMIETGPRTLGLEVDAVDSWEATPTAVTTTNTILGGASEDTISIAASCGLETFESSNAELELPFKEFVSFFSKINTVRAWDPLDKTSLGVSGGSRTEPTRFKLRCHNSARGCTTTCLTEQTRHNHLITCKFTSAIGHEVAEIEPVDKTYRCDRNGCSAAFEDAQGLASHQRRFHDWKPGHVPVDAIQTRSTTAIQATLFIRGTSMALGLH